MSQQTENEINRLVRESIFEVGLPRPSGTNTCYINSLVVALRCILNLLRLIIDSRLQAYFGEFMDDRDVLYGFQRYFNNIITKNYTI